MPFLCVSSLLPLLQHVVVPLTAPLLLIEWHSDFMTLSPLQRFPPHEGSIIELAAYSSTFLTVLYFLLYSIDADIVYIVHQHLNAQTHSCRQQWRPAFTE